MRVGLLIVVNPIGDHSSGRKVVPNKVSHQRDVLRPRQFLGQCDDQLPGELGVCTLFISVDSVPEQRTGLRDSLSGNGRLKPDGDIPVRHCQCLMHQLRGPAPVAERRTRLFVHHAGAMAIGCGRDNAATGTPTYHLRSDEHDRHRRLLTFQACRASDVYCALKPIRPKGRYHFCGT